MMRRCNHACVHHMPHDASGWRYLCCVLRENGVRDQAALREHRQTHARRFTTVELLAHSHEHLHLVAPPSRSTTSVDGLGVDGAVCSGIQSRAHTPRQQRNKQHAITTRSTQQHVVTQHTAACEASHQDGECAWHQSNTAITLSRRSRTKPQAGSTHSST